jgi:hemerythrin-like domain-containing protein
MGDVADSKRRQIEMNKKRTVVIEPHFMTQLPGLTEQGKYISYAEEKPLTQEGEEVSPFEDLMREHGILNRILLIYEEIISRMESRTPFPSEVLVDAARLVRDFIEDHHGKLEEDCLFPRFDKDGKLADLVKVLHEQHRTGRRLTDHIMALATPSRFQTTSVRKALARNMRLFNRMYRPHSAREDTVLFPAFYSVVSPEEFNEVVEEFEARELEFSGGDAIEEVIDKVAGLERTLGIYELSRFTIRIGHVGSLSRPCLEGRPSSSFHDVSR